MKRGRRGIEYGQGDSKMRPKFRQARRSETCSLVIGLHRPTRKAVGDEVRMGGPKN